MLRRSRRFQPSTPGHALLPDAFRVRPEDYPTRETALAIIAAVDRDEARHWGELEQMTGIPDVAQVAHRCWLVYGHPQLAPGEIVKRMNDVLMRPRRKPTTEPARTLANTPIINPNHGYGFTPRA